MKTNIIVTGACGRMGQQIISIITQTPDSRLIGAIEKPDHPKIGMDIGETLGLGQLNCVVRDNLSQALQKNAVVIDFSESSATLANLEQVLKAKAKMVIGTTGLTPIQTKKVANAAGKIPVVFAPNMSIGMNLLFKLTHDVARILGNDYDVEIIEAHHHFKKDSPSGSAKKLAECAASGLNRNLAKVGIYGRFGNVGERKPEEIGVHAVRAGDIVGDHTVLFGGMGERIELRHQAHSRETFARGAVKAALWLTNKKKGLFNMMDVLGL
jgi:4-hydroxy-tetrahydrodipicolinate reductase